MSEFFSTPNHPLTFYRTPFTALNAAKRSKKSIAVWATRIPKGLEKKASKEKISLFRIEDGFIRSSGLGSGFLPPASIIADTRGAYYDPAQPSDLEVLLATHPLDADLQERALCLIRTILKKNISKYSSGGSSPDLELPIEQKIILVPGQVADDLSVKLGGKEVGSNFELLKRVRKACPTAFILYRPHPDVDAGHRAGSIPDEDALRFANVISREGTMAPLLDRIDEVHTLTSLTGFEALMRGKQVTTYGQPFYAGWGLTTDRIPLARRTRQLTMPQLVAATLLLYPRYIDPFTGLPCGPELLIERLGEPELWKPSLLMRIRRQQGALKKTLIKNARPILQKLR
ncbi:capsule polysaccharide export protein [Neokomagataea thailandica NBRC 106555]|nr:capsule polysaccharide export protein [Neokomagataea thailandica NBRC 106555]